MNTTDTEPDHHDWFREQMAAYLAGGLRGGELARFESHRDTCPACAAELEGVRQMETTMTDLFATALPGSDFEDRLVSRLRLSGRDRRWIHPLVRRVAVAAALVIAVGGVGLVGKEYVENGQLPAFAMNKSRRAHVSNLSGFGPTTLQSSNESEGLPGVRTSEELGDVLYDFDSDWTKSAPQPSTGNFGNLYTSWHANASNRGEDASGLSYGNGHVRLDRNRFAGEQTGKGKAVAGQGSSRGQENDYFFAVPNISSTSDNRWFRPTEFGTLAAGAELGAAETKVSGGKTHRGETIVGSGKLTLGADVTTQGNEVGQQFAQTERTNEAAVGQLLGGLQAAGDAPASQPAGGGAQPPPPAAPTAGVPVHSRKVIREGVMEFEVDSFDSAFTTISRIVGEEGGFVAAADSDKLPNGKVKGTITLRVPPDRLDTFVLKLRALGELKSQRLGSKDVSKEYTDLESELRAARAMEERLLEMIKNAKGKVAELLEAEKELGNWRTRIERIQGTLNYYNNLVSMATLSVTAYEKDIRTPASASQTETINAGVETDDVEHARGETIKAIDAAKGRIVESELKQLEAGQLAAKVVAEVAADQAGPIVDRLRQLGRVARLDIQRKQVTDSAKPQSPGQPPVRVETAPTRLIVSMYNLANVAPRLTTNLNLAGADVEAVYRAVLRRVGEANGRVISSNLARQDATQASGSVQFELKAADADAVLNDIRTATGVQVLALNVTENPDTANVTTAKQAFTVQIIPAAQVPPRETRTLAVQTTDVERAAQVFSNAVTNAGGRTVETQMSQDNTGRTVARISVEVPLDKADQLVDLARQQGKVRTAESSKNAQVPEGPLSRARLNLTIGTGDTIVPGERGLWDSVREGLGTSVRGLLWSLQLIIIGVCLIAPWALILWGGWKLARRGKREAVPS